MYVCIYMYVCVYILCMYVLCMCMYVCILCMYVYNVYVCIYVRVMYVCICYLCICSCNIHTRARQKILPVFFVGVKLSYLSERSCAEGAQEQDAEDTLT